MYLLQYSNGSNKKAVYAHANCFRLVAEVKAISENVSALKAQLKQAEESLHCLLIIRGDLEREIIVKRKTLHIDRDRLRKIRSHYPSTVNITGY
jgi:tektin-4